MLESRSASRVVLRIAVVAAAVLVMPLTFRGVEPAVNDCGAEEMTGTCCHEMQSICNAGTVDHNDYYYKTQGCCSILCS